MPQINVHTTPEFEKVLRRLMRIRGLRTKSETIRVAVRECLDRSSQGARSTDFLSWIGIALPAPGDPSPRFSSDDDLWEAD